MNAVRESVSPTDELLESQNARKISLSPLAPDFLNRSTGSMLTSERPKVANVRWEDGNWLVTLQGPLDRIGHSGFEFEFGLHQQGSMKAQWGADVRANAFGIKSFGRERHRRWVGF